MRIATIANGDSSVAIVIQPDVGYLFAAELFSGTEFKDSLTLLAKYSSEEITSAFNAAPHQKRPLEGLKYLAPYRDPQMIWGIGLNYVDHASDLAEVAPSEEPASFVKGKHTIIGPGDPIILPWQSKRTTAEAEIGLVIGKYCRNVEESDALDYVFGVVPILDQTAEDILQKNPRFLTRSKNFPSFFSFGPWIMTTDEVLSHFGSFEKINVATTINGKVHRANTVSNMTFSPAKLLSFHSKVFALQPGDIISTGTPGAVHIQPGDIAECNVEGLGVLRNPVIAQTDLPVER